MTKCKNFLASANTLKLIELNHDPRRAVVGENCEKCRGKA